MADERCERKGADIIIKTTYDISLDFQDSLLPLGFLSPGSCPRLTARGLVAPLSLPSLSPFALGTSRSGPSLFGAGPVRDEWKEARK